MNKNTYGNEREEAMDRLANRDHYLWIMASGCLYWPQLHRMSVPERPGVSVDLGGEGRATHNNKVNK